MIHFLRRKRSGKIKQIPAGSRKVNRENLENAENKKSKAKIFNFKNDAFWEAKRAYIPLLWAASPLPDACTYYLSKRNERLRSQCDYYYITHGCGCAFSYEYYNSVCDCVLLPKMF